MLTGGHRWVQQYGDGTIANGTLFQDTLGFVSPVNADKPGAQASITASLTTATTLQIKNQPILVVDQPGLGLTKSYGHGVDGIIGLNLRSPVISSTVIQNLQKIEATASAAKAAKEAVAATTPLSSLLSSSARPVLHHTPAFSTDSKAGMGIMSLWLSKSLEPGQGGELLLNAVDKSRFREPIRWSARGPSPYDWSIMMDKGILLFLDQESPATSTTTVGLLKPKTATDFRDKTAPTATATVTAQVLVPGTEYTYAVLDSGSDGIYLAKSTYHAFFQHVPGARQLKSGYWRVPCEGTTELAFGIEGMLYKVPYQDWVKKPNETVSSASAALTQAELGPGMCQSRVFGSSPGPTLLGTVFLRAVYTVFDFSRPGHERMGFAALA
ncbi:aspartic peptidase domain-containing protein [Lobosporangium transversale]|uniref:Aspartic peptidase domain-containing protein n=1 Tax=Lobosporangium transversale TaxID=64571 RepID=A0A1Y2GAN6_9FUNG|nr:aspartic peptidase domain-containing protein [Lobosporangium transversale]ORZ05722.1 aspartic peptidase domain-containing protein [Lobosporangium transversale]|eukprot:XP_021877209.1 aspartic peptidase domain-containing protein [Lobosporangium transversale]